MVRLFLVQTDGSFVAPPSMPAGDRPVEVYLADLDGDDVLDIVTLNDHSEDVSVFLGQGDGSFDPALTVEECGCAPEGLAVGDVNGDGSPDLDASSDHFIWRSPS